MTSDFPLTRDPRRGRASIVPNLGASNPVPIIGAMTKSIHTRDYAQVRTRLKSLRASAGLSQRELASRLSVPHSWVSKVETGERRIDIVELCWFLSACGVDPLSTAHKLLKDLLARSGRTKGESK
jgi:DNA-binding XRE family transcriptional regulator